MKMKFGGIERDADWLNENFMKIPATLDTIIEGVIIAYEKEHGKSPYLSEEGERQLRKWKAWLDGDR